MASLLLVMLTCGMGGCVTDNEYNFNLDIRDNAANQPVSDCLLLIIGSESLDSEGYWWVVQDDSSGGGGMIPRQARVDVFESGQRIHQPGHVVMLLGPYVRGTVHGWEYWVFRPGYQPDEFTDIRVKRAQQRGSNVEIRLLREKPGQPDSDEEILDAARRLNDVLDFLPADDPLVGRLLKYMIERTRAVKLLSIRKRDIEAAEELLPQMQKRLDAFPPELRVQLEWKTAPLPPIDEAKESPTTAPAVQIATPQPIPELDAPPTMQPAASQPAATSAPMIQTPTPILELKTD